MDAALELRRAPGARRSFFIKLIPQPNPDAVSGYRNLFGTSNKQSGEMNAQRASVNNSSGACAVLTLEAEVTKKAEKMIFFYLGQAEQHKSDMSVRLSDPGCFHTWSLIGYK